METDKQSVTPVVDFVKEYNQEKISRFHMPGHKGKPLLGCEPYDITEIKGADILFNAEGILAESQKNASAIFRTGRTFFSAGGSSLCIKAMLCAVLQEVGSKKKFDGKCRVLAARNVHKAFVDACALLDLDMVSFVGDGEEKYIDSICYSSITANGLRRFFEAGNGDGIIAVYVTSVDYLGNIADISGLSEVCDNAGIPLVVDNAHGAYLAFLETSAHPIHNGAAICCDSAHKTLPVLTGGAYIHISDGWAERLSPYVSRAMALFGSTSPSYLILQSLDLCNRYLREGYYEKLQRTITRLNRIKEMLKEFGIQYLQGEPLKLVVDAGAGGYTGYGIADELREYKIECEYADGGYVVLMVTPENDERDYLRLEGWAEKSVLRGSVYKNADKHITVNHIPKRVMSIRDAMLAPSETISIEKSLGRVCAAQTVSCPPAIPIVISGEEIDSETLQLFKKYEIHNVCVVKEQVF